MEKFDKFKKYMHLYQRSLVVEAGLKKYGIELSPDTGIQLIVDELLSWIPDLIMNHPETFWEEIRYDEFDEDTFDNYIEELWERLQQ
jgi:hypothetical protein